MIVVTSARRRLMYEGSRQFAIDADGAIARLIICRLTRFHRLIFAVIGYGVGSFARGIVKRPRAPV
jgi:hypothetical protein